ncbi:PQQ-dependent sugar dehydrogenase [Usitatibacter palustris]|uniref:Glucose/Sorbosone dehydrogenase domain-containing protein n=1 Tax=Usitatibacter palustris TaxID=2732487 RepID=A0A6M4HES4_9PROT|nr:PQQ-dependent sugar dehydrogenase [Usitatibacter palustris]QJR16527.1 hypothetical protein DSM104440_03362 [Usitatibacter palustris]
MNFVRVLLLALLALPLGAFAQPPQITPQPFVSGIPSPVEITNANDYSGRLFILELGGRIRVVRNGAVLPTAFLDLTAGNGGPVITGGERGLLGLAFHPLYASNGRFYVFYTRARAGDANGSEVVIARYNRSAGNPDVADGASGSIVMVVDHPSASNHNGGKIAFGPDGYLYIAIGDGGTGGAPAQMLTDRRGKILRIDVDSGSPYAIPPTNPYFGSGDPSVRQEIWALGLRNPWKFSFDRLNGDMYIGDVGQSTWEEIDHQPNGAAGGRNYGWPVFEGMHCFSPPTGCSLAGHVPPVLEYPRGANGGNSITGGYRYRGSALSTLTGYYVYGDFGSGRIWATLPGTWAHTQIGAASSISAFGEDESGELYVVDIGGTVLRVTPSATTIPRLANISTRGHVSTGQDVMIGGFIIGGTRPKTVVVTVAGPSLANAGVPGPLADPRLTLVRSSDNAVMGTNDNWQSAANAAQLQASGFAPSNVLEPAIMITLAPGAYTAIVEGTGTGVGLVGVYELDHPEVPLTNISTRGQVLTGDNVMIAGLIIQGNGPQTVVITVAGPSLANAGIANPLANPIVLIVRASDNVVMGHNDNWQDAPNAAAIQSSGFAPANPLEPAVMVTLAPGAYTAIVQGVANGTGVGLVGVYRVQ